jgi:CheY-like chemotaxis protein
MEKLLRRRGYEVVSVEDGGDAVEAAATTAFDLILMDLQMPVLDGLAATREIRRASHSAGAGAFIIALTAQALRSDRRAAEDAGFDGFLEKPLAEEELNTILGKAAELRDSGGRRRSQLGQS